MARLLDRLGIRFEYEPASYLLDSGRHYRPDFRFTSPIGTQILEVRGYKKPDSDAQLEDFALEVIAGKHGRLTFAVLRDPTAIGIDQQELEVTFVQRDGFSGSLITCSGFEFHRMTTGGEQYAICMPELEHRFIPDWPRFAPVIVDGKLALVNCNTDELYPRSGTVDDVLNAAGVR